MPVAVAESLSSAGQEPFVVIVADESEKDSGLDRFDHAILSLEEIGHLVPVLKKNRVTHAVLAGGISRRPSLWALRPTWSLARVLPEALTALSRGDDALLRILIRYLEAGGVKVVGAHEVVPDLLAASGPLTRCKPERGDAADLRAAFEAARAIGALDIGQAAVSIGGRVIALEGVEGTDGLLHRVASLRGHGRMAGKTRGVLVKCAKPRQEMRADLPAIGPATVEGASAAGLVGIGIEAGRSFVLDAAGVFARADALGVFIIGLDGSEA